MTRGRLFGRLYRSYLLAAAAAVGATIVIAAQAVSRFQADRTALQLETFAKLVGPRFETALLYDREQGRTLCDSLGKVLGTRLTVILPDGAVVGDSEHDPLTMESHADRPEVKAALAGKVGRCLRYSFTLQKELLYVAVPVLRQGKVIGVVRVAMPARTLGEALRPVRRELAFAGLVLMVILAGISFIVARRISLPIERMKSAAQDFAVGRLGARLIPEGPEELRLLAESLNVMASQLDARIRELSEERRRVEAILSSMEEGIIAVEGQGSVFLMNPAAYRMLGMERTETGKTLGELCRDPDLCRIAEDVLSAGQPISQEIRSKPDGGRLLRIRAAPIHSEVGQVVGAVLVLEDVTELRRLERIRRDFVANVAHELRTPITSILGFVETLLESGTSDESTRRRFLEVVRKQSERLRAIVDDLLLLARVEAQQEARQIRLEPTMLRQVLEDAMEICAPAAADKKIQVELECEPGLVAEANPPLLTQAVVNLLDNAIKYSEPGGTVRLLATRGRTSVAIRVEDQGCGIPEEHLARIFERFYRVDKSRSRQLGGTGLGLSIVKHIAEAHRGRVTVESRVGAGSVFTILLPIPSPGPPAGHTAADAA
jgi:two-component system phosphate regulon sensor histidine kinase PhoR